MIFHQSISPYYLSTSQWLGCTSLPSHTALEWYKKIKMIDNQIPDLNRAKMKGRSPLNFLKSALHSSKGNITATVLFFEQQVNIKYAQKNKFLRSKFPLSLILPPPPPFLFPLCLLFVSAIFFYLPFYILYFFTSLLFSSLVPIAFSNCL